MDIKKVHNLEEFINYLGNDTKIIISEGIYLLSSLELYPNEQIFFSDVFDGRQLVLRGFKNIEIKTNIIGQTSFLCQPRYANVLTFIDCDNITIDGLVFGHTEESGYCYGGVLQFENCTNIRIINTTLYGCGTEGLSLAKVKNFSFVNSTIKECTYRIMTITDSYNVQLIRSKFFNNGCYDLIRIGNSEKVKFCQCEIYNNWTAYENYLDNPLFNINFSKEICVIDSYIHNNLINYLVNNENVLIEKDNKEKDNILMKGRYNKSDEERISLDNPVSL